jgi:hypothetical protein
MAKLPIRILGYVVGKVTGSNGQFGRLDNWAVIRLQKHIFPSGLETIITDRHIMSRHDSKEAALTALKKYTKSA